MKILGIMVFITGVLWLNHLQDAQLKELLANYKRLEAAQDEQAEKVQALDGAAEILFVNHEKRINYIEKELKPH